MLLDKIRQALGRRRLDRLYKEKSYLEAYREHTDLRAKKGKGAGDAIGGKWDEIGPLQFEFLRSEGLAAGERMLDYGCGTLRGGRFFIEYLDTGGYTGVDISRSVIEAARAFVAEQGLSEREPTLVWNEAGTLDFSELGGEQFDVVLAQSVFTHLLPEHIEALFSNLDRVLKPGGRFYFTNFDGESFTRRTQKDFEHAPGFYAELAERHGLGLESLKERYAHPRGQSMYRVKAPGGA